MLYVKKISLVMFGKGRQRYFVIILNLFTVTNKEYIKKGVAGSGKMCRIFKVYRN